MAMKIYTYTTYTIFVILYSNREFILIPNEFRELKMNVGILSQALDFSDKEWRQEWENHL